ncbi:LysR family transcriptional regulator [Undibacterium macrobrachii]|jgi:DNA-binding transcriptional LysR family regulator|uniref:LysR family transcriptional regulator n=1 Tax=Undibacterium macrobrachii TaxID=1119058 RepID=A0ABQ2XL82_9BURK|nr:LysR family transcriptional regulator [Undibacterium macrobrachii]GGX22903.1 LysR family transcriptional regulator [Undibacterium macrobrachii]
MHLSRTDLNLFVVLDAIYSQGSITRASQVLNLSQPALSHALARLRTMFDDPLFVRQGAAMVPTSFTRGIITQVRQGLQLFEASLQTDQSFHPAQTQRRFHLGLRDVFEATILPPLVQKISEQAPGITIASVRVDRREIETALSSGDLDMVLEVPIPLSNQIRQQRVSRDRLIVLSRKGHPQMPKKKNQVLDLDIYLQQAHVLVSSRRQGVGLEDFELNREGLRRQISLRCQHYFAACRVVSETDLLLTMPEQYASIANAQFMNRIDPFPLATQPIDAHLYWHSSADNDPANSWLREQLLNLMHP